MAKCQSIEAVQAYGESVLSDISKHLTADQTGSKHRVILELLTYLDEHYDQDIGLSELADRAGMSTAYLSVLLCEISDGPSHKKGEEAVAGWI